MIILYSIALVAGFVLTLRKRYRQIKKLKKQVKTYIDGKEIKTQKTMQAEEGCEDGGTTA